VLTSSKKYVIADQNIDRPKIDISQLPRAVFWWRTTRTIKLHSGERISVKDRRVFRVVKPSTILDFFGVDYQLWNDKDHVIFRFCTHGVYLPGNEAAHIHYGNEKVEEGDGRLNGQSLVGADFLLFFKYVCSYLDQGKLPWQ
jgi:hypothetical protein